MSIIPHFSPQHHHQLQLWDTAGQERFRKSMVQHYYRNVHAVLFVYDVTCPASFRSLTSWIEECRQNSLGQEFPRFLVGNKSDLRDSSKTDSQDKVDDIVVAVGAKLKRQKKPLAANPSAYGSFKVMSKKRAEKELWTCC
ncbi:ras-related protein Rab-33B-like isoform X2 [Epinephelus fuscoguttatus]|uniref:ras-related protein Rab-33B-like isoform X2 n=1 Tax=Epinephelus fuscoguttatus TaxID=293821 RepID=UPI0020D1F48B|nr:ras-related protein Rab-33B-like isoform X2 [Epinephelus fuscoguttatus]